MDANSHVVYLLVGGVVGLKLLVVGELDVDRVVANDGHHCGVIAHHILSCFLRVHLQEGLTGQKGGVKALLQANNAHVTGESSTWFLALSISRLVTSPKGRPRLITSVSVM